jgi:ADP-glucose pyrophosphorylase
LYLDESKIKYLLHDSDKEYLKKWSLKNGKKLSKIKYKYMNSEKGFVTKCISSMFAPSRIKERGLIPLSTKKEILNCFNDNNEVLNFAEKKDEDNSVINGGFFVCEPSIFNYLKDDTTIWEKEPLENLAKESSLNLYLHTGFWKPMDSLKDKMDLNEMWISGKAEWKIWK